MDPTYLSSSSNSNSSSMNSLRPLLPRAEGAHGPSPSDLSTGKRRKASNACTECRSHKTKCDQGIPACSACHRRGTGECIYIPGNDGRRRDPVERLRKDNEMMKMVLQAIKSLPQDEASNIVDYIRSDYSLEYVVSVIQSRGGEFSDGPSSSFTSPSNSASAEVDSPPRRSVGPHAHSSSPERNHSAHSYDHHMELPPIANHHDRRHGPTQEAKLPVFEASRGSMPHPLDDEYRRFPPTL